MQLSSVHIHGRQCPAGTSNLQHAYFPSSKKTYSLFLWFLSSSHLHLIFLINKHEAHLLPHSYMRSSFFYCDIFLTTKLWINIHNHQYPSELQKHIFTDCESGWFSSWCLAVTHTHTAPNASSWTWIYFHICRLVLFMFRHMSPAVQIPHLSPLCFLILKKKRCSR